MNWSECTDGERARTIAELECAAEELDRRSARDMAKASKSAGWDEVAKLNARAAAVHRAAIDHLRKVEAP